jgi:hypothetical protein
VSRVWVRDHWNGGWITVFWTQLHRVAAPFGELAWDHARSRQPGASEEELADAVDSLLRRASQGPDGASREEAGCKPARRDRRVAARTRAAQPLPASRADAPAAGGEPATAGPGPSPGRDGADDGQLARVIPMPIFDPFAEADKPW